MESGGATQGEELKQHTRHRFHLMLPVNALHCSNAQCNNAHQAPLPSDASSQCIALQCTVCDQGFKSSSTFKSHHHRSSFPSVASSQCNTIHSGILYTMQYYTKGHLALPIKSQLHTILCTGECTVCVQDSNSSNTFNTILFIEQSRARIVKCSPCD